MDKLNYLGKPLSLLLLMAILFPYITPVKLGSDIQVYSLLLSTIFLVIYGFEKNIESVVLITFSVTSMILFLCSDVGFKTLRSCLSTMSFSIVTLASYRLLVVRCDLNFDRILLYVLLLYMAAGLVQMAISPSALLFLSPRDITYGGFQGRGVDGLAAEPTFYGFCMVLMVMLCYAVRRRVDRYFLLVFGLATLQIVFFAKSSSAFISVFVIFFAILWNDFSGQRLRFIPIAFFLPLLFFALYFMLPDESRILKVVNYLVNPAEFFNNDLSANDRFYNVYYAIGGFFDNFGFPNGFGAWNEYAQRASSSNLAVVNFTSEDERILSLVGGVLFEYGVLSIFFFYMLLKAVWSTSKDVTGFIAQLAAVLFLFIQAIPISHPIFALWISAAIFYSRKEKYENTPVFAKLYS